MKLGIMQPYFFPYIGYFQLLSLVDQYVIYDDVNYIKGGWINRNRILSHGSPIYINVPMKGASSNKLISEVEVSADSVQRRKLLCTIKESYSRAPYFQAVFPMLKTLIDSKETNLALYLENTIREICGFLGIKTAILRSSEIAKRNELRGQDKVLEICRVLCADEYYNAIGGMELYRKETFQNNGVDLFFIQSKQSCYHQMSAEFIPSLSIIDVMMNCTPGEIQNMLKEYTIV